MGTPVEPSRRDDYDTLASRVARVEGDVRDIKETLTDLRVVIARMDARIEAQLPHLATKAEIASLEARMEARFGGLEAGLAEKPSKTYMWGILGVLLTAYGCGLAALAVLK